MVKRRSGFNEMAVQILLSESTASLLERNVNPSGNVSQSTAAANVRTLRSFAGVYPELDRLICGSRKIASGIPACCANRRICSDVSLLHG